jgi:hypothetical protein
MINVQDILISEDLFEKKFVCDLNACKGACCVEGDSGAPLEKQEVEDIEKNLSIIKTYMNEEGLQTIHEQGVAITDYDGDLVTPLVGGNKQCAFTIFENGVAKCSIEKAWKDGKINFRKPVSCHLYPVRLSANKYYELVNVHYWETCKAAYACGEKLQVPVYRFLKDSLIRRFGEAWYNELELVYQHWNQSSHNS